MQKLTDYQIYRESIDAMWAAQRIHRALEICFTDETGSHTHTLSAGTDDEVHVHKDAGDTCVLSLNNRLGYVGLQVFRSETAVGEIFFQEGQVAEASIDIEAAPVILIRQLREYIIP